MKITKLLKLGTVAGAGMLLAPKDGKSLRKDLGAAWEKQKPKMKKMQTQIDNLVDRARHLGPGDARKAISDKLSDLKTSITSINGTSVKNVTSKSVKAIRRGIVRVSKEIKENEKLRSGIKKTSKVAVDMTVFTAEKTAQLAGKATNAVVEAAKGKASSGSDSSVATKAAKAVVAVENKAVSLKKKVEKKDKAAPKKLVDAAKK